MCDIRYFRMARHHFISAKEALKCFSWDELFINDTAYKLQQCVEFTLKAFLECKGVTVSETHQLNKLIRMSKDNGSACIITEWLEKNAIQITEWESQTRYNFDYYLELQQIQEAISEIDKFLSVNGLTDIRDPEITKDIEEKLLSIIPKNYAPTDNFELNVYYHIFKKRLSQKKVAE